MITWSCCSGQWNKGEAWCLWKIYLFLKKKKSTRRDYFSTRMWWSCSTHSATVNEGLHPRATENTWKTWKQKVGKRVGYQQHHFASEFTNPRIIYLQTSAMRNNKPLFGLSKCFSNFNVHMSHLGSWQKAPSDLVGLGWSLASAVPLNGQVMPQGPHFWVARI